MARIALLRMAVTAAALGVLAAPVASWAASAAPSEVALTGTYQLVAAQAEPGATTASEYSDLLVVGQRAYRLDLDAADRPASGTRVRVTGERSGSLVQADTVAPLAAPAAIPAAAPAKKVTKVLVILATWGQPDAVTSESAVAQVGHDDDAWMRSTSYGASGLTAAATPWLHIAGPDKGLCFTNQRQIMDQAKSAAGSAGFSSSAFDRTMLYFPRTENADCSPYGGWSYQPGTDIWLNGRIDRRTTVHELGHAMGLWHAASLTCTANGTPVPLADDCTKADYGDPADAMGSSSNVASYSAVNKDRLGWLAGRTTDLTAGGVALLAPVTADAGTVAATVQAGSRTYYIAYRRAIGVDAGLPVGMTNGALIHEVDPARGPHALLLDMTPGGDLTDAALPAGRGWVTPEGFTIRAGRLTSAGLEISVSTTAQDVTPPPAVAGLKVAVKKGAVTVSWSKPAGDVTAIDLRRRTGTFESTCSSCTNVFSGLRTSAPAGSADTKRVVTYVVTARDSAGNVSRPSWISVQGATVVARSFA